MKQRNTTFLAVLFYAQQSLSVNAQSWSLTGNAGTNGNTNFIGTTDSKPLVF